MIDSPPGLHTPCTRQEEAGAGSAGWVRALDNENHQNHSNEARSECQHSISERDTTVEGERNAQYEKVDGVGESAEREEGGEDDVIVPLTPASGESDFSETTQIQSRNSLPRAHSVIELNPVQVTIGDWSRLKKAEEPLWAYFDLNLEIFHVVTVHAEFQYLISIPFSTIERATFCLTANPTLACANSTPDTLVVRLTKPPNFYGSHLQGARVWTSIEDFTVDKIASDHLLYAFSLGVPKFETERTQREKMILDLIEWENLRNVVKIMTRPSSESTLGTESVVVQSQIPSSTHPNSQHFYDHGENYSAHQMQHTYFDSVAGYSSPSSFPISSHEHRSCAEEEHRHYETRQSLRQYSYPDHHYHYYMPAAYTSPETYSHPDPYPYNTPQRHQSIYATQE